MEMNIPDSSISSPSVPPLLIALGARSFRTTPSFIRRIEEFEIEPDFTNKKRAISSQSKISISPDNLLDHLLGVSEGKEIIRYYKKYNCLNDTNRKKLVNVSVDYLTGFFDRNTMPSTYSREELAKSIVVVFPKLRDPDSPKGYEAFYEPATQKGFITTRLRTIFRKRNVDVETRRKTGIQSDDFENSSHIDEQESLIEVMKNKDSSKDAAEVYDITRKTFWYRRKLGCDYNKYPRFLDTKGLVSLEFELMYPDAKKLSDTFPIYINKILEVYHLTLHSKSEEITNEDGDNAWSKLVRAFLCILHILPPSTRGRNRETAISAQKYFIQFQKSDVPIDEVMQTNTYNQPFLLAVGPSKRYCETYYLVFNDKIIPINNMIDEFQNFLTAVDILIKAHFVFNIEYNVNLKSFYDFILTFFYEISEGVTITSRMREFRCKLKN